MISVPLFIAEKLVTVLCDVGVEDSPVLLWLCSNVRTCRRADSMIEVLDIANSGH